MPPDESIVRACRRRLPGYRALYLFGSSATGTRHAESDLAMHLVRKHGLAVPQESRDAFRHMVDAKRLDGALADRLERMVGFRSVAMHDYQRLDPTILKAIVRNRLVDLEEFARHAVRTEA